MPTDLITTNGKTSSLQQDN